MCMSVYIQGFLKSALLEYFDRQAASEDEEDGNDNTEVEDAVSPTPAPKAAKGTAEGALVCW